MIKNTPNTGVKMQPMQEEKSLYKSIQKQKETTEQKKQNADTRTNSNKKRKKTNHQHIQKSEFI